MKIMQRLLQSLEGDFPFCICCKQHSHDVKISGNGIGICSRCYEKLMESRVDDYYDIGGRVGRLFSPFCYQGKIRDVVLTMKFQASPAYATPISRLLFEALPIYYDFSIFDAVIPVPLHRKRFEERGYNQAELIAHELSVLLDIPLFNDVLFRIKGTKRQMALTRYNRMRNVSGAFWADKSVFGKNILLIDDIYTAGATINECASALDKKGAAVINAVVLCTNFKYGYFYVRPPSLPGSTGKKNHAKG